MHNKVKVRNQNAIKIVGTIAVLSLRTRMFDSSQIVCNHIWMVQQISRPQGKITTTSLACMNNRLCSCVLVRRPLDFPRCFGGDHIVPECIRPMTSVGRCCFVCFRFIYARLWCCFCRSNNACALCLASDMRTHDRIDPLAHVRKTHMKRHACNPLAAFELHKFRGKSRGLIFMRIALCSRPAVAHIASTTYTYTMLRLISARRRLRCAVLHWENHAWVAKFNSVLRHPWAQSHAPTIFTRELDRSA